MGRCGVELPQCITQGRQGRVDVVEIRASWAPTAASDVNPMATRAPAGTAVHVHSGVVVEGSALVDLVGLRAHEDGAEAVAPEPLV